MKEQFCVIVGGPIEGFRVYGPFSDSTIAGDWAEEVLSRPPWYKGAKPWWVTKLESKDDNQT